MVVSENIGQSRITTERTMSIGRKQGQNDDGNHDYDDRDNERRVAALVAR
jgi:hypothetical protein